jgi:hypothetical protein
MGNRLHISLSFIESSYQPELNLTDVDRKIMGKHS